MTATLHKLTAGDGYQYYIRHIAAHDASERGRNTLSDYYSAKGESPGRWHGSGLRALGIRPGDMVTEAQMQALFGEGRHPDAENIESVIVAAEIDRGATDDAAKQVASAATRLGNPYRIFNGANEFRHRCADAYNDHNTTAGLHPYAPIPDEDRARIRTGIARTMFAEQYGRGPLDARELSGWVATYSRQLTTAVAGFDFCFSPVKSVSTLWAVAPRHTALEVEAAHHAAIDDAMRYLEQHATWTRLGRNGVRQVEVEGLITTMFDHRDSRAGDPDLHTHVVVANKVRTLDGLWRSVDGSMFYQHVVTASEVYNTRLEHHLEHRLGVRFAERAGTDPAKRPIREIVGVEPVLNEFWSQRDKAITSRLGELATRFQAELGREPIAKEMFKLMQRATLETRQRKHSLRSLAQQRADWRTQALTVLGNHGALATMVAAALNPPRVLRPVTNSAWITRVAEQVMVTVSGERTTWRRTHVRSEVERQLRGRVHPNDWAQVGAAVVTEALSPVRSIARGDPDIHTEPGLRAVPEPFRRRDGSSVYRTVESQIYTSPRTLADEAKLIEMSLAPGGHTIPDTTVTAAVEAYNTDPANKDRQLNHGQIEVIRRFATSGRRIQLANAPAGSGKTTAMRVLTDAWRRDGGTVLGHTPTARAAAVLDDEIHARVSTIDKLLDVLDRHTPNLTRIAIEPDRPPPSLP